MSTISKTKSEKVNVLWMTQIAVLIAIIFLMAFTPIGYLPINAGLKVTLIPVPVVIGAIILGPVAGAVLGTMFGIRSFLQCFGAEPFGTALFAISPVRTFILCMIPRILMGVLCGLVFKALFSIDKTKLVSYGVANLCGPLLNTILFMSSLWILFKNTEPIKDLANSFGAKGFWGFIIASVGINALIEASVCLIIGTAISKTLAVYMKKLKIQ